MYVDLFLVPQYVSFPIFKFIELSEVIRAKAETLFSVQLLINILMLSLFLIKKIRVGAHKGQNQSKHYEDVFIFEVVFMFEVVFIFEVIVIFEVIFILRSSSLSTQ